MRQGDKHYLNDDLQEAEAAYDKRFTCEATGPATKVELYVMRKVLNWCSAAVTHEDDDELWKILLKAKTDMTAILADREVKR